MAHLRKAISIGARYGLWRVVRSAGVNKFQQAMWLVVCDGCGRRRKARGGNLRRHATQGCASCRQSARRSRERDLQQ
jgi:hypothetical protein